MRFYLHAVTWKGYTTEHFSSTRSQIYLPPGNSLTCDKTLHFNSSRDNAILMLQRPLLPSKGTGVLNYVTCYLSRYKEMASWFHQLLIRIVYYRGMDFYQKRSSESPWCSLLFHTRDGKWHTQGHTPRRAQIKNEIRVSAWSPCAFHGHGVFVHLGDCNREP